MSVHPHDSRAQVELVDLYLDRNDTASAYRALQELALLEGDPELLERQQRRLQSVMRDRELR